MNETEQIEKEILMLVSFSKEQRLRPNAVEKELVRKLGISLSRIKLVLNDLVKKRELVYTYRDPYSYLEIPRLEVKTKAARPMKVVIDEKGEPWICDSDVDPSRDLAEQGCWQCGDMAFTRND